MKVGKVTRHDEPRPVRLGLRAMENDTPVVLVRPEALSAMYNHAAEGYPVEVIGCLLGLPLLDVETGVRATYIEQVVRGIATASHTHVIMDPESFKEVDEIGKKSGTLLVGNYHSHPEMGVFQSGTDVNNFKSHHNESYRIAIVLDSTLTTHDRLDTRPPWIGFFAWDKNHKPIRLPAGNAHIVNERPMTRLEKPIDAVVGENPRVPSEGAEQASLVTIAMKVEIAHHLWQASKKLSQKSNQFDAESPIIIVSKEVINSLMERSSSNIPDEGLLLGASGTLGGYDFLCVMAWAPIMLETLDVYENAIRKVEKSPTERLRTGEGYEMPLMQLEAYANGADLIGLYGMENRLDQLHLVKRQNPLFLSTTVRDFAKFCGKYCLTAARVQRRQGDEVNVSAEKARIQFRALRNSDQNDIVVPQSQIIIIENGS